MSTRLFPYLLLGICLVAPLATGCSLRDDGRSGDILFVRELKPGVSAIYLMSDDGSEVRRLVAGDSPRWSPDGTRFAYTVYDQDGGFSLWVMNPETNERRRIVSTHGVFGPAWAPDGIRLAYTDLSRMFVINTDTGASEPVSLDILVYGPLDWSPDGRNLLVSGTGAKVLDLSTGVERAVASRRDVGGGRWSPDGERLALAQSDRRYDTRRKTFDVPKGLVKSVIVVGDQHGGNPQSVTSGAYDTEPAWSHDGGRIYFTRKPPVDFFGKASTSDLYVVELETGSVRRLTEAAVTERSPDPRPTRRSLPDVPEPVTGDIVVPDLLERHVRLQDEKRRFRALGLKLRAVFPPDPNWLFVATDQVPPAGSRVPRGTLVKVDGSGLTSLYHHFRKRFSARDWKRHSECRGLSPRARMYWDLVERVLRRGLRRERIFSLLGEPARSTSGSAAWPVGRLSSVRGDCIYLRVEFHGRGRVTRFYQSLS